MRTTDKIGDRLVKEEIEALFWETFHFLPEKPKLNRFVDSIKEDSIIQSVLENT